MLRSLRVPFAVFAVAACLWPFQPRANAQPARVAVTPSPSPVSTPTPSPMRTPSVLVANPRLALTGQNVTFVLSPANGVSSIGIAFGDGFSGTLALVPGTQTLTSSHAYAQPAPNGYQACVVRPVAAVEFVAPSICALVVVRAAPTPSPTPFVPPAPTASPTSTPSAMPTPGATPTPLPIATPAPTPSATPSLIATPTPSATPAPLPSATPTPTLTPMPTATLVTVATPSPTPAPTPTPTPVATSKATASPTPTSHPAATPGALAAPDAYVIVTFPDGSHALSVPYGGIAPAPYAQIVSQTGGRATVQWSVDGVVVTTSTIDVLAHAITRVNYAFMLPVGGNHTLVATLLPVADALATPDPRAYVQYRYAAPGFAAGNAPAVAHITLLAPSPSTYVPSIDDALQFAWSEDTPGTARDFIVRFLDRSGVQVATADMGTAALLTPDVPLKKRLVAAAIAGKSATDHNDLTWEVNGVVSDARGQQRLVESSDRWPLAATDVADGLGICQTDTKFLRGDSTIGFNRAGSIVSMLGALDLTASPYAAAFAPSQNDGYVRFANVFVDWGDGRIEALALRTKLAIDERAGPIVLDASTGPGHRYSISRDFHTRIFELPATLASPSPGPPNVDDAYAAACTTLPSGKPVPQ